MNGKFWIKYNLLHHRKATKKSAIRVLPNWLRKYAFSLVEMLMALLVASLLMTALAPVVTKKMNEKVAFEGLIPAQKHKIHEIEYGKDECAIFKDEKDNSGKIISSYCEGEFTVPTGFKGNLRVTVIGAGGGGAAAPSAGYKEYTSSGSVSDFVVPALVDKIEATLVSSGAAGAGGGVNKTIETFVISGTPLGDNGKLTTTGKNGTGIWKPSAAVNGANVIISACGGGGGGAIGGAYDLQSNYINPGHGAYFHNKVFRMPNNASNGLNYRIGGGGSYFCYGITEYGLCTTTRSEVISNGGPAGVYGDLGCIGVTPMYGAGGSSDGVPGSANCCVAADSLPLPCIALGGKSSAVSGAGSGGRGGKGPVEHYRGSGSSGGGSGSTAGFGGQGGASSHSAAGGGGGGGSTWLGYNPSTNVYFKAGGGGGGVAPTSNYNKQYGMFPAGGGGGGGSGTTGLTGGNGGGAALGDGGIAATSGGGGTSNPIFGTNYCIAGRSGLGTNKVSESLAAGRNGAMRISYLDYGPGGSGGGGGQIVPIQKVATIPNEAIKVIVGSKTAGGNPGNLDSTGNIIQPGRGEGANANVVSKLQRQDSLLLTTAPSGVLSHGAYGGSPIGASCNNIDGFPGLGGSMTTGIPNTYVALSIPGFSTSWGNTAGDGKGQVGVCKQDYLAKTVGGTGGRTTLFNSTSHCSPGAGGVANSISGQNATGYGGCAGGGGYSFGKGGNGTGGYARISWNKYWDTSANAYKYAQTGAGGGGSGGNIMSMGSIPVNSGERIKIQIGKGGEGGKIENNTVINAKKGGDTVFGYNDNNRKLIAGGGNPGNFMSITGNNINNRTVTNGTGGSRPNNNGKCSYKGNTYINNANNCSIGTVGGNASTSKGGAGGVLNIASLPLLIKNASLNIKSVAGNGGNTGNNSYGGNADEIGGGGGGAGIFDIGTNPSNVIYNPNKGGNGSDGKIIIEWWE